MYSWGNSGQEGRMTLFIRAGKEYRGWVKKLRQVKVTASSTPAKLITKGITPARKNTRLKSQKRASKDPHLK